uniref:Uncharacterized protein n=1 Tax=Arundo donax TaxID=35708 RepID=A0A0A8YU74_ARUDO
MTGLSILAVSCMPRWHKKQSEEDDVSVTKWHRGMSCQHHRLKHVMRWDQSEYERERERERGRE